MPLEAALRDSNEAPVEAPTECCHQLCQVVMGPVASSPGRSPLTKEAAAQMRNPLRSKEGLGLRHSVEGPVSQPALAFC
uniref:Uncharacterized protein n=1 Tax=Sphaerodactylus townsendi TaxID=933632 RepID=A0ACB8E6E4_9SAUR